VVYVDREEGSHSCIASTPQIPGLPGRPPPRIAEPTELVNGMRVLVLSNMYPSDEKPYAGVFVKNQVEILREDLELADGLVLEAMPRRFTGALGTALKYLGFAVRCVPHAFRRYDVLHVHYFVPLGLLGAAYKLLHPSSSLLVTFHGGDVNPMHFRGLAGRVWRAVSRSVDHGIAVGPGVAGSVAKHLDVKHVEIRPAGVDSRKFYPQENPQADKEYDLVFVGSFSHRKGIDLLVTALQDEKFRSTRMAFVGTGPMRDRIESLDGHMHIRIFDGLDQDELRKIYWASKFLVLTSRSEPFGLVVSEAMYCGVPVIVSDEPGPLSQVKRGINGFVFESESVRELQDALCQALAMTGDEYMSMARAASSSNKEFDIYAVTRELEKRYQSLTQR